MRLPFRTAGDQLDHLVEPGRSPLIPLTCLLAIAGAIAVVGFEVGARLALITAAFTAVGFASRLPRVVPGLAAVTLLIAAFTVLVGGHSAPAVAAAAHHVLVRGAGK